MRMVRTGARSALVAVFVALVVAGLGASPAGAAELPVSGTFTGDGYFTFTCGFAEEHLDGGGDWASLGATTFHLDYCVDDGILDEPWPVSGGTFTITTADGTLTGSVAGEMDATQADGDGWFPFRLTLTVTAGTGAYDGATGAIDVDGRLEYVAPTSRNIEGSVSGTVTTAASTPTSADDCKAGGWRELVDDTGAPFANQGACVSWVNHPLRSAGSY
jgi:hypothetical protein